MDYFLCIYVLFSPLLYMHCLNVSQFTMELAGTESGHIPKCYSMDMSKDLIPMSVFSESSQGKYKFSLWPSYPEIIWA